MNLSDLARELRERDQPAYRLPQVKRAFYAEYLPGWESLTTFPKALREDLATAVVWDALKPIATQKSADGDTAKTLLACEDGNKIEAVLMRHEGGRNTVCISSQVGCPMGCGFCATGTMGFKRNLTRDEMMEQVIHFARFLKDEGAHVTNVVFMGMGEPMHNYDEVMASVRLMNDPEGFNLGARHISISTCGIVPGILKLMNEPLQVNLAISLHSAIDATRSRIMPVNKAYPLEKLMDAVDAYAEKTNRKVFFEYLLLDGINDTTAEAHALAKLLRHNFRLYHVNLIKYHDTNVFTPTETNKRLKFMGWLQEHGVPVTHRRTFGEDIDAACGQLAVNDADGMIEQGRAAARSNNARRSRKAGV